MTDQDYIAVNRSESKTSSSGGKVAVAIVVVLVAIGSFVGGMQYQKKHTGSTTATISNNFGPGGRGRGGPNQNGTFGTVTASSVSSISVKNKRSGATKTYSISSDTTITNNGSNATYSDIAVGDTVMVAASSSTSTAATRISLNPTMGGGPSAAGTNSGQTQ